jgi:uncharacterized protein (DUF608 family)
LVDWEIYNRPNKGSVNGFSHFAIRAGQAGAVVDARVLHSDLPAPYSGAVQGPAFASFGFGPRRELLAGLPHFRDLLFQGQFPLAELQFIDESFPGKVVLRAFNPFIPLNERDSGIPAAFFEFEVSNTTGSPLDYTLAGVLSNPLMGDNLHTYSRRGRVHLLQLETNSLPFDDLENGTLCLATDALEADCQRYWFRGMWFDNLEVYWHDWAGEWQIKDRAYDPAWAGTGNTGMLAVPLHLDAGQTGRVRFVISWSYPNCSNTWNQAACDCARDLKLPVNWLNYYATQWKAAADSAEYALSEWDRLERETRLFMDVLFSSSLPQAALEAVSANLAVLKSPTVMRLEDGTFYGWEGCHPSRGCCEGSCTHVWNYAQALAFLFPRLERSMRSADYHYNLRPDGGMPFRLQLPLGTCRSDFRPCADGQFGGVLKAYRDWKICGDTRWLRSLWPAIYRSIAFAWSESNEDRWDPDRRGILTGRQHHTLDMELFGPNAWLTGFYLAALKAGAEMARALEEHEQAADLEQLFFKGKTWADANLFNGEYYCQLIDLHDRSVVEAFAEGGAALTGGTLDAYWDAEHGEIKYQIGEGCEIDQVLAQWHANLYGLGEVFSPVQVKSALQAIFRHNFRKPMRNQANPCRLYCLNDEGGLVIASWPADRTRPVIPLPYSQETQNGYEYAAAIQMIQSGLIEEGLTAVQAIRERYDGEKRNPWNEIECGSNYARSLASYALLNAFSGFSFDLVNGCIGFQPVEKTHGLFRCFWSLDPAWGEFRMTDQTVEIHVVRGELPLRSVDIPLHGMQVQSVWLADRPILYEQSGNRFTLADEQRIAAGQVIQFRLG